MSDEQFAARMNEGAAHYRQSHSAAVLRLEQTAQRWRTISEHLDELCGFIDAMCDDIQTLKENKKPQYTVLKPLISNEEIQIKVKESIAERALHERIKDYARFCRFGKRYPLYNGTLMKSLFRLWMENEGRPLSDEGNKIFDEEYLKEK